jgi:UDP:flavonoid glycosyltransferase YjiC (YdhE family)
MSGAARKTIIFFPEGAFGPTNNCVGIGAVLRERGHRVVFVVEESFAGTLEAQGFEERRMRLGPPTGTEEAPGQFWKDFIRDTAPIFRRPTIEQLEAFIAPTFAALLDGARHVDERLHEIFDDVAPDVIVEDNVVAFPAISASGRPWVRIVSCSPTEIKDDAVPPAFSGYPTADRAGWADYRREYARTHAELHASFDAFGRERGAPPLPGLDFIHESPWLNLYIYPETVDYARARPLNGRWDNLQTSVRSTDAPWEVPEDLADGHGALVYLSLGSARGGSRRRRAPSTPPTASSASSPPREIHDRLHRPRRPRHPARSICPIPRRASPCGSGPWPGVAGSTS